MATINQFYRFEDAREVASMSQGAKRISYATYKLTADINLSYVNQTVVDVLTNIRTTHLPLYNLNYNANFVAEQVNYPSGSTTAQIYVYDVNIITNYPLLRISMVFETNSSGVITSNGSFFLGYVNEYYQYDAPLLSGERDAYRALINTSNNSPAIFPRFYKYDQNTGVANSLIARYKNCKFENSLGRPVRDPLDSYPRGGAPLIAMPPLNSAGKYIIGLFDELIEYSGGNGITYFNILEKFQTWVLPDGYLIDTYEDGTTAQRLQINVINSNGNDGFVLLLRQESTFKFQRLYAPFFINQSFLIDYSSTLALPYEPVEYKVRYYNSFYDYDLCEFNECPVPQKESYLMPAKTGDLFRFNVFPEHSNTDPIQTFKVGLFDCNGNLIQNVGSSLTLECSQKSVQSTLFQTTKLITFKNGSYDSTYYFNNQVDPWAFMGAFINAGSYLAIHSVNVNGVISENYLYRYRIGLPSATFPYDLDATTPTTFFTDLAALLGSEGLTLSFSVNNYNPPPSPPIDNKPTIDISITGKFCCEAQFAFIKEWNLTIGEDEYQQFTYYNFGQVLTETEFVPTQQFANALIPQKNDGYYRLGLYNKESAIGGLTSNFQEPDLFASSNYIALVDDLGIAQFCVAIPSTVTNYVELHNWLSAGNASFFTLSGGWNNFNLSIYPYVTLLNWTIQIGSYDFGSGAFTGVSFAPSIMPPTGETNINELYSLSNVIDLDNGDCFSTMVQYYSNSGSVVTGNEYLGEWYQQCRLGINGGGHKPVITESTYRQSNGIHKRPQSKQDLSIDLHTDFLDFETQCALVDATRHPYFVVDGRSLFVNGDIEVATVQDFTTQSSFEDLAQVKFSALVQGYQPKNSTCINC